jgi:hypothetical protein
MSLRWRETWELLCGAKSQELPGDLYFDDGQQYEMSRRGLIIPDEQEEDEFIARFILSRLLNTFPDKSQNVDWVKYD